MVVWQYAQADRPAVASGGIAGAVGAGKSIQSEEGTEECLTKPDGKVAASSWGLALGQMRPCAEPKKTLGAGIPRCVTQITDKLTHAAT
jgi:hypothetical protein